MKSIAEIKSEVKPFVPDGWLVCEGFFLCLSTSEASNSHVSITPNYPREMKFPARLKCFGGQLAEVLKTLKEHGLKANMDRTTIYVFRN